jgi:hypothetical protein
MSPDLIRQAIKSKDIPIIKQELIAGMVDYMEYVAAEGKDPGHSKADIDRCSQIIDRFLASLTTVPREDRNDFILAAVKTTVLELNQLNEDCRFTIIETDQRELLCALIILAANNAGLVSNEDDITYQWRKW